MEPKNDKTTTENKAALSFPRTTKVEDPQESEGSAGIIAGVAIGFLACGVMIYLVRRRRGHGSAAAKHNMPDEHDAEIEEEEQMPLT